MQLAPTVALFLMMLQPLSAFAWNIPGHMITASIAYRILKAENQRTASAVQAILEKHP
jgi:hypothetical protein